MRLLHNSILFRIYHNCFLRFSIFILFGSITAIPITIFSQQNPNINIASETAILVEKSPEDPEAYVIYIKKYFSEKPSVREALLKIIEANDIYSSKTRITCLSILGVLQVIDPFDLEYKRILNIIINSNKEKNFSDQRGIVGNSLMVISRSGDSEKALEIFRKVLTDDFLETILEVNSFKGYTRDEMIKLLRSYAIVNLGRIRNKEASLLLHELKEKYLNSDSIYSMAFKDADYFTERESEIIQSWKNIIKKQPPQ